MIPSDPPTSCNVSKIPPSVYCSKCTTREAEGTRRYSPCSPPICPSASSLPHSLSLSPSPSTHLCLFPTACLPPIILHTSFSLCMWPPPFPLCATMLLQETYFFLPQCAPHPTDSNNNSGEKCGNVERSRNYSGKSAPTAIQATNMARHAQTPI